MALNSRWFSHGWKKDKMPDIVLLTNVENTIGTTTKMLLTEKRLLKFL